jgi:hypothetical protein
VGRPLWRERSLSRVRVPWNSWPYFTASDLRFPLSSSPTTRRVTVEVFDPASTRNPTSHSSRYTASTRTTQKACSIIVETLQRNCLATRLGAYYYSNELTIVHMLKGEGVYRSLRTNGSSSIVACVFVAARMCLAIRRLAINHILSQYLHHQCFWKVDRTIIDLQKNNKKFEIYSHSNYTIKFIYTG